MFQRSATIPASSLAFALLAAALATGCSAAAPQRVAFAVNESAIARVNASDAAGPNALKPDAPSVADAAPTAKVEPVAKAREIDDVLSTCRVDAKTKKCAVTSADADEICRAMTPTAALRVFLGNKKLRLGYLTRDTEVWSTTRAHATKSLARFDEEVLVLSRRSSKSGVIVSGASVSYEVLRWDGTCASLMSEEITFKRAPQPVRPVQLQLLYLPVQTKLLEDDRIQAATDRADAACHGDAKTVACDAAKRAFGATLVARSRHLAL